MWVHGSRKTYFIIGTALFVAVVFAVAIGFAYTEVDKKGHADGVIAEHIFINGMDVSGMNQKEAAEMVDAYIRCFVDADITLKANNGSVHCKMDDLQIATNEADIINQALTYGKKGNIFERYMDLRKLDMENTSYSVFVIGGKTKIAAELIISDGNLAAINKIIADDMNFTSESAAFPLSYSTNFIDDASKAVISRSTEYVKTTVAKRNAIHVKTDKKVKKQYFA